MALIIIFSIIFAGGLFKLLWIVLLKMWKISRGFKEFSDRIDRLIALQSECLHFNKSKKQCKAVTGQIQDFDPDKLKKQHKCCLAKYFESHVPKQFCSTLSSHFRKNRQEKADNSWEDLHLKHPHAWLGAVGWVSNWLCKTLVILFWNRNPEGYWWRWRKYPVYPSSHWNSHIIAFLDVCPSL